VGILDLFHKDEVRGSKVLVCGLEPQHEELVASDSRVYRRFYACTVATLFSGVTELAKAVSDQYDIIHLLCDLPHSGTVRGTDGIEITGAELLRLCCGSNVKLLWIASENEPDRYINTFDARGKRINLAMTIHRSGSKFTDFLDKLLFRMHYGDTMPVAWANLCPQIPTVSHSDAPSCIFFAGRGGVRLR
jgi:hypothetical protein